MTDPPRLPDITQVMVQQLATDKVFERGCDYYEHGAVLQVVRRGNRLFAEVEGSDYEPYQVVITLGKRGIGSFSCTCPYDWEGACKHVVAVLLTYICEPRQVEDRPPIETLLEGLSDKQLRNMVLALVEQDPRLIEVIEEQSEIPDDQ